MVACQRILDDQKLATLMRQANYTYYRSEVEPGAHVVRLLERSVRVASGELVSGDNPNPSRLAEAAGLQRAQSSCGPYSDPRPRFV